MGGKKGNARWSDDQFFVTPININPERDITFHGGIIQALFYRERNYGTNTHLLSKMSATYRG